MVLIFLASSWPGTCSPPPPSTSPLALRLSEFIKPSTPLTPSCVLLRGSFSAPSSFTTSLQSSFHRITSPSVRVMELDIGDDFRFAMETIRTATLPAVVCFRGGDITGGLEYRGGAVGADDVGAWVGSVVMHAMEHEGGGLARQPRLGAVPDGDAGRAPRGGEIVLSCPAGDRECLAARAAVAGVAEALGLAPRSEELAGLAKPRVHVAASKRSGSFPLGGGLLLSASALLHNVTEVREGVLQGPAVVLLVNSAAGPLPALWDHFASVARDCVALSLCLGDGARFVVTDVAGSKPIAEIIAMLGEGKLPLLATVAANSTELSFFPDAPAPGSVADLVSLVETRFGIAAARGRLELEEAERAREREAQRARDEAEAREASLRERGPAVAVIPAPKGAGKQNFSLADERRHTLAVFVVAECHMCLALNETFFELGERIARDERDSLSMRMLLVNCSVATHACAEASRSSAGFPSVVFARRLAPTSECVHSLNATAKPVVFTGTVSGSTVLEWARKMAGADPIGVPGARRSVLQLVVGPGGGRGPAINASCALELAESLVGTVETRLEGDPSAAGAQLLSAVLTRPDGFRREVFSLSAGGVCGQGLAAGDRLRPRQQRCVGLIYDYVEVHSRQAMYDCGADNAVVFGGTRPVLVTITRPDEPTPRPLKSALLDVSFELSAEASFCLLDPKAYPRFAGNIIRGAGAGERAGEDWAAEGTAADDVARAAKMTLNPDGTPVITESEDGAVQRGRKEFREALPVMALILGQAYQRAAFFKGNMTDAKAVSQWIRRVAKDPEGLSQILEMK